MVGAAVWIALLLAAPAGGDGGGPTLASPAAMHFALVADESCVAATRVEDFRDRTLLVSRTRARFVDPGRPESEALDVSADLPAGRGESWVFATRPPILQVTRRPARHAEQGVPHRLFRFAGGHWIEMRVDFGDVSAVLPVETGLVVTGWVFDRVHGDSGGVPVGDLTRAWRVALDGTVSSWSSWPYVMSWQEQSTSKIVWAVVAKPRRPGLFLLRAPIDGRARFFTIPGLGACRGDDRLGMPARLLGASDDEARVSVYPTDCKPPSGSGTYRLLASRGRWVREGPWQPEPSFVPSPDLVVGGRTFTVGTGEVLVRDPGGETRRYPVPGVQPGGTTSSFSSLDTTATGREVWVHIYNRDDDRCRIYRYEPGQS